MADLKALHQAVLDAEHAYERAREAREQSCTHGNAVKRMTHFQSLEVRCPDCEQSWSLSFSGYGGSNPPGPRELTDRWRYFVDRFIRAEWGDSSP